MSESTELVKKLQIKTGTRLWLIDAPANIAGVLAASAAVEIVEAGAVCDGVLAFAENPSEATKFSRQVLKTFPPDGLLWFAYRKGASAKASGLSRDTDWSALAEANWRPVRSVSIDAAWTGLRFRPVELVKSDKPDAWRSR